MTLNVWRLDLHSYILPLSYTHPSYWAIPIPVKIYTIQGSNMSPDSTGYVLLKPNYAAARGGRICTLTGADHTCWLCKIFPSLVLSLLFMDSSSVVQWTNTKKNVCRNPPWQYFFISLGFWNDPAEHLGVWQQEGHFGLRSEVLSTMLQRTLKPPKQNASHNKCKKNKMWVEKLSSEKYSFHTVNSVILNKFVTDNLISNKHAATAN